ncbi:MAG: excinuclease ABC subunit UvrC [Ardenticatenaceae bacterium]|nr:excinuclease ABC subunit UvrC [Anaerolineales bacterium]MCB8921072.1 excinuclease ABC subunit UvrC [Ardenticatenaceae bacterium]MCB8991164.1 excinuclease ABC subunit UvrC [Ardenticatenaceae bacterium]MCB9005372.1 excinuclease ABC subunit UvrC [Ardenticatenaceae bacterium]
MSYTPPENVQEILKNLPTTPGVYLHKNKNGVIIYVGKAINLRNRVRSYFHANVDSIKTQRLRHEITDIEIITVDSELEALLLENTLIKKHQPKYNVRLKDDKRYPYIKVHWNDPFPKVTVTRRMERDGSRYFGPYTSVWAVHQTLDLLRKIFPYLTCDRTITGKDERACLYYDIKLCNGPCIGAVNQQQYRAMIKQLMDFLDGRSDHIITQLEQRMMRAAEMMQFERAAEIRDQLKAVNSVVAKQKVISAAHADQDVIAFAREQGDACVQVFFIRYGKLIGREYFLLDGTEGESDEEVLQDFITQFYDEAAHIPKEVLLPHEVSEAMVIEEWLRQKRSSKVTLQVPRRGQKKELVEMATRNAGDTLGTLRQQWAADRSKHVTAMSELQEALNLPTPPSRIECYDISHTQGAQTVASMVVFVQGAPKKSDYRRFNIHTVTNDDYGAMKEALTRRFARYKEAQAGELHDPNQIGKVRKETAWAILPDLLIVDGGKGQLSMAVDVLRQFGLENEVPLTGLAKQEEELFVPGQSQSIWLPRRSEGLYLVQRVRDEAHRFANEGHRKRRSKVGVASILDGVPGVGPSRRKALLTHFGSLDELRKATEEEIASVPGVPLAVAQAVKAFLA